MEWVQIVENEISVLGTLKFVGNGGWWVKEKGYHIYFGKIYCIAVI